MPFKNIVWSAFAALAAFNIFILVMFSQVKNGLQECARMIEDPRRTEGFIVDKDLEVLRRDVDTRLDDIMEEMEGQIQSQPEAPQVTAEEIDNMVSSSIQALGFRVDNVEEDIKGIYNTINELRLDINRLK